MRNTSYGIILFDTSVSPYRVLLVKRRFTFAFTDFLYRRIELNRRALRACLKKMTIRELVAVSGMDFNNIWDYFTLRQKRHDTMNCREKFNNYYTPTWRAIICKMIQKTRVNNELSWEIPKGKQRRGEYDINAAIREFREETGIMFQQINFYPHIRAAVQFFDDERLYRQQFYVAELKQEETREGEDIASQCKKICSLNIMNYLDCNEINHLEFVPINEIKLREMNDLLRQAIYRTARCLKRELAGVRQLLR